MSQHTTDPSSNETPYGYCHCGCGQKTNITAKNDRSNGCVKGQPKRYIVGHHNRVMPRTNQATSLKDAFLRHAKESTPIECWEWQGAISAKGYGRLTYNQKRLSAHRVAYELYRGEIPNGFLVCHLCDNPRCCNPHHLWLGTAKENTQDAIAKGRLKPPRQYR